MKNGRRFVSARFREKVHKMNNDPFKEYLTQIEPDKQTRGYAWNTAIGLQAVDGLQPSAYLLNTAIRNIEGEITMKEAQALIDGYYNERPKSTDESRTEEADKVSARIAELLSENAFSFTATEYLSIHRKLFTGIYEHAGQIRNYNISKKEWVLDGESVTYGTATELRATLEYDLAAEKAFNYEKLSIEEVIRHLAWFAARLWQIHVFGEGNTRTTAVFLIKYLRTLGFQANNDIFADNAWYFRNALVRANYNHIQKGIHETTQYLELFLRNLLLDERHPLQSRSLHIRGLVKEKEANIACSKPNMQGEKPNMENVGVLDSKLSHYPMKTRVHAWKLYQSCAGTVFGRTIVMDVLKLKSVAASELIKKLLQSNLIEPVSGHGKGKYRWTI